MLMSDRCDGCGRFAVAAKVVIVPATPYSGEDESHYCERCSDQ